MTTIAINPMVVSVSPSADATITRIQPTMHGGGGGIKKLVAVVAAVAIPFAAPVIASSIGLSGAIAAAGASSAIAGGIGSAIVGAGLGAISAKVTGQDVRRGAIMGGISGGIAGYFRGAPQTATSGSGVSPTAAGEGSQLGTDLSSGSQAVNNIGPGDPTTFGADAVNQQQTLTNLNAGTPGGDVAAQLSNTPVTNPNLVQASYGGAGNVAQGAQNLAQQGSVVANQAAANQTALSQLGPNASFGEKFVATMKDSGSALANRFTDPEALANVTMQAGGQLLGTVLAPDPEMPPEQRELLEQRKQELAELKERDEAAFNAQMDAAKQYLQQAKQYDPTYMAFQAANKEAIDQQRKLREQYRRAALSGGRDVSEAEKRRMSLDSARQVSSEYDRGFQQGLSAQNKVTQAGLSAIPNTAQFANYTNALRTLQSDEGRLAEYYAGKSQGAAKNISDLFSNFNTKTGTGYRAQQAGGQTQQAKQQGGLPDSGIGKKGGPKGGLITPEDMEEFYQPDKIYSA